MLKLLSREGHPHLNSLLTTYHQNKRFYLVFHWAEWDLWKYWEKHDPRLYGGDDCSVFWMVRECAGLASSLLKIHGPHDPASFAHQNSFDTDIAEMTVTGTKTPGNATASAAEPPAPKLCHHGDIKAINILVFSRPDTPPPASSQASSQAAWPRHVDWTLKISDFGMAGFHNPGREGTGKTTWTPAYVPPEWETRPESIDKLACDIWALGCVFLQFVGWYLGGFKMVEDFEKARVAEDGKKAFYYWLPAEHEDSETESALIKPSVKKVW